MALPLLPAGAREAAAIRAPAPASTSRFPSADLLAGLAPISAGLGDAVALRAPVPAATSRFPSADLLAGLAPLSAGLGDAVALRAQEPASTSRFLSADLLAGLAPLSADVRDAAGLRAHAQLAFHSEPDAADPLTPIARPVEDELVLEMRLGRYILSDGFLGYLHRGGLLLPLGEVAAVLDFAIVVDPVAGRAEGWFLRESRTFVLDLSRGEAVIEGRKESLPRDLVELHFDDIYVDTTLLARWFPVDLDFNLSRLSVHVTSREPLPIEERLARERIQGRLGQGGAARPAYPRLDIPYLAVDMPFLDVSTATDFDSESGATARYTALLTGDLLYMDTRLFIAGNDEDKLDDVRLTLGRKDPDGALFGSLGVSEFSLGDVFTPRLPLVARQTEGRGATVSTFPLARPTGFDRTTLRGELPLGWEVELYRNEVLLDFQRARADGRYEFVDVPLLFGLNVLHLAFYGPQGQRREKIQRLFVGAGMIRPGDQYWRVAVNQQDEDTIPVGDNLASDELQGEERIFAEYERGLNQNFSVAGSVASFALDDGRHNYGSLGLRAALLGSFMRLDVARDSASGTALQASVQTDIFGVNLFAEHDQFFDFVSERFTATGDPIESRTNLRIDATIPEGILPRIPVSLDGEFERRESGRYDADIGNRLSVFFGGVSASNKLDFRMSGGGNSETMTSASGSLLVNSRFERVSLRGTVDYAIDPVAESTSVSLTADRRFDDNLTARLALTRQLTGEQTATLSPSVSGDFGGFAIGVGGSASDDGTYSLGLTLSFGLGREPRYGSFALRPRGLASNGAASARVFLDRNQNGRFDEGDEPLSGVRFQRRDAVKTDDNGIAFLTGLSSYRPHDLSIDVASLEDPYWLPIRDGVEIVPRPGKTILVEFPVTATGEVDGTVFLRRGSELREVANVRLQLVDADGSIVKEVKSQFDGFYLFDFVPPGRYLLRVSPAQVARLKLRVPPAEEIVIEADGNVVSGVDLVLDRAREQETNQSAVPRHEGVAGPVSTPGRCSRDCDSPPGSRCDRGVAERINPLNRCARAPNRGFRS